MKAYILNHRRGDQTRIPRWTLWGVALIAVAAVVVLAWQVW